MPYEDKFRSVREHGPRPGTEAKLVGDLTAEEVLAIKNAKTEATAEEPQEQLGSVPSAYDELTLDELRALKNGQVLEQQPRTSPPPRSVDAVLFDLEKMIVDEDGVFDDTDPEQYVDMILDLIHEAREGYTDLMVRLTQNEYD